jgi:hypothetical protein
MVFTTGRKNDYLPDRRGSSKLRRQCFGSGVADALVACRDLGQEKPYAGHDEGFVVRRVFLVESKHAI